MSKSKSNEPKLTHPRSVRINVHQEAVQACLDYVQAIETKKIYRSCPEDSEAERDAKLGRWSRAFDAEMKAIDRMHALAAILKLSK